LVRKAEHAGFDSLIVDVKPLVGEVLYDSRIAPRLGEVKGFQYPQDYDLLQTVIEEAKTTRLKVHAAVNVFSEGHRDRGRGPGYKHPEWQVISYEPERTFCISGVDIHVYSVDPWNLLDEPVLYVKTKSLSTVDRRVYLMINDDSVLARIDEGGEEIAVPDHGCVLVIPSEQCPDNLGPGDAVKYSANGDFRKAQDSRIPSWGLFVNPIGPAREYELSIVEEIVTRYDVDGIVFDRMRFPNLNADFSDESRVAFQAWLGDSSLNWPGDVYKFDAKPWNPPIQGRYYKKWLEWRSAIIKQFAVDAVSLVRNRRPGTSVGVYVGSWYESYYDVGVNWASEKYRPGYSWMTPAYNRTGYAERFDFICAGAYYPTVTRAEARASGRPEGATVEAGCELAMSAVCRVSPVLGSLYVRDYEGRPDAFSEAIKTALRLTNGIMLFDLVQIEQYGWWEIIREMMK